MCSTSIGAQLAEAERRRAAQKWHSPRQTSPALVSERFGYGPRLLHEIELNAQLLELISRDGGRCIGQRTLCTLRLGKRDDVTD